MDKETRLDDRTLLELRLAALFTHNAAGRIVTANELEPDPSPAPRLFLGRTVDGNAWRFRHDVPPSLIREIEPLLVAEPPLSATDPRQPPRALAALRALLATPGAAVEVTEGPAWRFPDPLPVAEHVVFIAAGNRALLEEHFPYTAKYLAARQPCAAIVEDGAAVSICYCARRTAEAAEAGVDTAEGWRGRGYAGRVTAAWAAAVRRSGRIPLYSTSWQNAASQAVARKLGLTLCGVDLTIT